MTDFTHLQNARAVAVGDENHRARLEAEALARTMHEVWAGEYVRRLETDDPGPAIAYLHQLRHETEGADPWRLIEQVATAALTRKDG